MLASRFAIVLAAFTAIAATGIDSAARTQAIRPFDHRLHESVSCRSCHGTGSQHRASFIRTPRDCAGCHHDRARARACGDCHAEAQLASVKAAVATLSLSVWDSAQLRSLPFAHTRHERIECKTCHATPVTLARSRECASCHEQHHRAEAQCSTCHRKPDQAAHPRQTHLSCGATQCHSAAAPPANSSRNLCLICHDDKRTHEAGGACASCHKIPDSETAAAALGGTS
ncbi:MAG TPA: hypothetical protein VFO52_01005 [Longimicrobiales bacterium]|nr:hypothetical protein [Longimicrobiales bacterium]